MKAKNVIGTGLVLAGISSLGLAVKNEIKDSPPTPYKQIAYDLGRSALIYSGLSVNVERGTFRFNLQQDAKVEECTGHFSSPDGIRTDVDPNVECQAIGSAQPLVIQ